MCAYLTPAEQIDSVSARLLKRRRIDPISGCWLYTGAVTENGYGIIVVRGRRERAHRVAMHVWRGFDLASDQLILHRCDVRACFCPDHLFIGSPLDNMRDMIDKGRAYHPPSYGNRRLTDADVRAIRARRGSDIARVLAQEFGVSKATIHEIWQGHTWKHLD